MWACHPTYNRVDLGGGDGSPLILFGPILTGDRFFFFLETGTFWRTKQKELRRCAKASPPTVSHVNRVHAYGGLRRFMRGCCKERVATSSWFPPVATWNRHASVNGRALRSACTSGVTLHRHHGQRAQLITRLRNENAQPWRHRMFASIGRRRRKTLAPMARAVGDNRLMESVVTQAT